MPAWAEDAGQGGAGRSGGIEEIIVTAQKRAENIQDVPIAITAISGDALREKAITEVQSLVQSVPGVVFSSSNGEARISIRGVAFDGLAGGSAESRVAYHLDGQYMATTGEVYATFFDVERVEVLRGPQGTLFGRNAIAGSVNVITRAPSEDFGGYLQIDVGDYDRVLTQGAVTGKLAEGVSARLAFKTENRKGYEYNPTLGIDVNNVNTRFFRGKLKFDSGSPLSVTLSGDYFREDDRQGFIFLGVYDPATDPLTVGEKLGAKARDGNPRHDFSNDRPGTFREYWGIAANAKLELGGGLALVSITGYRNEKDLFKIDIDGTAAPLIKSTIDVHMKQASEELRLEGTFDRARFIAGVYMFYRDFSSRQQYPLDFALLTGSLPYSGLLDGIQFGGTTKTFALAGFAEGTYDFNDVISLTLGGRYSWERKKKLDEYNQFVVTVPYVEGHPGPILGPYLNETQVYKNFSPRVTLTAKLNADTTAYATYSKGFRSGGYNLGYQTPGFFPEKMTDYEVGLKTELFDRRLRLNIAGFYYDYKDLQVSKANSGVGNTILNAASAKLYGGEVEAVAVPVDGLRLDAAVSVMKSKFASFTTFDASRPGLGELDLAGNRLPQSPRYTASYGAQYTLQSNLGEFTLRGEGRSISSIYFDQFNRFENGERAFTIVNAILSWKSKDEKYFASAYIRNIGDVVAKNGSLVFSGITGFNIEGSYDPPRTIGASFGVNF